MHEQTILQVIKRSPQGTEWIAGSSLLPKVDMRRTHTSQLVNYYF
jgi:hypothetical protein